MLVVTVHSVIALRGYTETQNDMTIDEIIINAKNGGRRAFVQIRRRTSSANGSDDARHAPDRQTLTDVMEHWD